MRICAFLLILGAAIAAPLSAQSLADVARQEAQRRQTLKDSGKSYSNQDLKPAPMPPPSADAQADSDQLAADDKSAATTPGDPAAAAAAALAKDATGDEPLADKAEAKTEQRGRDYWVKRMADLRQQLDRDQTYFDAMQSRINALTTDFVNRDDPAQRSQIAADRQKALTEFDRLKNGIEADKKAIADAEEEARRADVPAGWLR
jgi:hypothetical protein